MTSPLLALFVRSLREDSRVKSTYYSRAGLVLITLIFLLTAKGAMGWTNAPGLHFFHTIIILDLIAILLAGVSYFASAITEEKEEMTLGLLRMTNLSPVSILSGKSTSRLFGALLLLAAQFPFTLLAIALGGVAMNQIVAAYCCLGAFLILIANLALLASVVARRTSGAAIFTGVSLFGFFALLPFVNWITQLLARLGVLSASNPLVRALAKAADIGYEMSPFARLGDISRTGFQDSPGCLQVWSNLGIGIGCFIAAWAVFEIFCGEQKESAPARGILPRRRSLLRIMGAGRVWPLPLAWKDFHFITGGWFWVLIKFVAYAVIGGSLLYLIKISSGDHLPRSQAGYLILWASVIVLQIEIAFAAASIFRNERQWRTLSSLAMLPQGMQRVAYQKVLGIMPALIPAGSYLLLGFILAAPSISEGRNGIEGLALFFSQCLFFHHFVANLSLRLKRGALPVALGLQILLNIVGATVLGLILRLGSSEWSAPLTILAFLAGTVVLHFNILARLKALAAE